MTARRCECCDLPVESCGREAQRRQDAERIAEFDAAFRRPGVIPAQFIGKCARCDERIRIGDPLRGAPDGWIGELCCGKPT